MAVEIAAVLIIYWALLTMQRSFRLIASAVILLSWPLLALVGILTGGDGVADSLGRSLFPWVLSSAIWGTYLNLSRRVRVTFENKVRADDPFAQIANATDGLRDPAEPTNPPSIMTGSEKKLNVVASPSRIDSSSLDTGLDEEALWERAIREFDSPQRRMGLWAKVFAASGGNESVAKAAYLSDRFAELRAERFNEMREREKANQLAEAQIRKAAISEAERNYALLPKGECPNCGEVLLLDSTECPKCKAIFGLNSSWKIMPINKA